MLDIYTAFEQIVVIECINNKSFCERATHDCKAKNYWQEFGLDFKEILAKKNLEQIIQDTYYECKDLDIEQ